MRFLKECILLNTADESKSEEKKNLMKTVKEKKKYKPLNQGGR